MYRTYSMLYMYNYSSYNYGYNIHALYMLHAWYSHMHSHAMQVKFWVILNLINWPPATRSFRLINVTHLQHWYVTTHQEHRKALKSGGHRGLTGLIVWQKDNSYAWRSYKIYGGDGPPACPVPTPMHTTKINLYVRSKAEEHGMNINLLYKRSYIEIKYKHLIVRTVKLTYPIRM